MASMAAWRSETGPVYRALFALALLVFGGSLLLGLFGSLRVWGTPPPPIYDPIALGKSFYYSGDLEGAARELRIASVVSHQTVNVTAELEAIYRRLNDRDGIVRLHEARVAASPLDLEPRFALGLALVSAGRTEEGIAYLEMVRQAAPGYPGIHEALAVAYLQADRLVEAEAVVGEGLTIDPLSAGLHQQLAFTLQRRGNAEAAQREFERAARIAAEGASAVADPSRGPAREAQLPGMRILP